MNLPHAFNAFYEKIELGALSQDRILSAWGRLHEFLVGSYRLPATHVFIQGSYANGTAVRPEDDNGEYDVDIVVVCADLGTSADAAVADLRSRLERSSDLSARLEKDKRGRPCVRLRYADDPEGFGFHIDIVPSQALLPFPGPFDYPKWNAPLAVPMRGREQWRNTAPLEYTQWCLDRGDRVRRTVRELKRWRDVHDAQIKSIVLQVLVGAHHPVGNIDDAEAILRTLEGIRDTLAAHATPPVINNPVLPDENLADRWPVDDFQQFLRQLDEAITLATRAKLSIDEAESHSLWRELLGEHFPPYKERGVVVPPPPPPGHRSAPQQAPGSRVEWG